MSETLRVLIVEDLADDATLLILELQRAGWQVTHERVQNAPDMNAALDARTWDIIISDYSMPCFSGLEALTIARRRAVDIPFILVSGTVGEEVAVQAMKAGANDYLFKGNFKRLGPAVERELRDAELRREARRTEKQLLQRDRQLADAQRLACIGSWHMDFGPNLVEWSEELGRILGRTPIDGSTSINEFVACIHPDDQTLFWQCIHATNSEKFAEDFQIVLACGGVRFVHIRGDIARDASGTPLHAGGMVQDITERKIAERELRFTRDELAAAKDAAEAASHAKDHFIAILSHELRTPLTPILALVSLWQAQTDLPEALRGHLDIIRRNIRAEVRLIDDLLDLTSIVSEKLELHYEVVDVHNALHNAVQHFQLEIGTKNLNVELNLGAAQYHVWADPVRMQQVFANLLDNAIKFTSAGGVISIGTALGPDNGLRISFRDNGIGIEPDVLPRLFNRFEQGERTITRRYGGLGLGLSIAKSLVEMQHGAISATSDGRGKGADLSILLDVLPLHDIEDISAPRAPTERIVHRKRVLLVEDHKDTRSAVARLLKESGCLVKTAETAKEALEQAQAEEFDILVSDIGLPDGSGIDIIKALKARRPIKGIAVSGFGQAEDLQRSLDAGFAAHLTKPVDFKTLQDAIDKLILELEGAI